MKNDFQIGQTFDDVYPFEAALWANENGAVIVPDGDGYKIIAAADMQ